MKAIFFFLTLCQQNHIVQPIARKQKHLKNLIMPKTSPEYAENRSLECLVRFKRAYKAAFDAVENLLKHFYPSFSPTRRTEFLFSFFPFLFGIYPYAFATKKQIEAMNRCGFEYPRVTIYELVYQCVTRLLCTSGGSGLGQSGSDLAKYAKGADVKGGKDFTRGNGNDIKKYLDGILK